MKDQMLRGDAAPTGFAASVSGWLRTYVHQERRKGGLTANTRDRLDLLDSCASLPVAVGDNDPRIRSLALACPGTRWEPGSEQLAAVHGAGHRLPGDDPVKVLPDELLNAIAHAATLDLAVGHGRELSRAQRAVDAAPAPEALLKFERDRADQAEEQLRRVVGEQERLSEDYKAEKARRREMQSLLDGSGVVPHEAPVTRSSEPRPLPEGVRKKGSGYQAYFKVNDKTASKILPTVDEAVRWRRDAMDRVVREAAAQAANSAPQYDADLTPEQIDEMRAARA